ncbi:PIN domain-containing protein [Cytobacillus kochii]|uniref:PIN domain-containing protein n=1 Tax=Cytobacillus kochii TaxID=859143 RepID=UPI00402AE52E
MSKPPVVYNIRKASWSNMYTFPDMIYIDTNAVIDIFQNRPYGQLTEDYFKELNKKNGMIVWSSFTMDEVSTVLHNSAYQNLADYKNISAKDRTPAFKIAENTASRKESIQIATSVETQKEQIQSYLEQFGGQTDVTERNASVIASHIYKTTGLSPKDSKHVAISNLSGINNILTQDAGFLRVSDINIFGSSQTLVNKSSNKTPNNYVNIQEILDSTDNEGIV